MSWSQNILITILLCIFPLAGCVNDSNLENAENIPDPEIPTPQSVSIPEPLQSPGEIPNVIVLASSQPKQAVAELLDTTLKQLDRTNPTLPDPIPPYTLIVIPVDYQTLSSDETLNNIAQVTGISISVLETANPGINRRERLSAGTTINMPRLYYAYENTTVDNVATMTGVSVDILLENNPDVSENEEILAGNTLLIPAQYD